MKNIIVPSFGIEKKEVLGQTLLIYNMKKETLDCNPEGFLD